MTLNCEEIYFASNEKSALTGQDGFSVRTFTRGMDTALVAAAASECIKGYEVSPDRQLNLEDLLANPRVVYDFPPVYSFSRFTDTSGNVRWVFGRTVYIATDYGFFYDTDTASRVGSNYFAHILLSKVLPPAKLFAAMAGGNLFRPFDYTVAPSNAELRGLLTGEAALLDERIIDIPDADVTPEARFLPVVKAILAAWLNRSRGGEESMGKVIVKANAADTAGVLRTFSLLPDSLMDHMTFLTNYMQGYGVPQGYDIAVVNEFNTRPLYEENYVVADLISGNSVNIPANPVFDAMERAVAESRYAEFRRLIEFFLAIEHKPDTDYAFLLKVFNATMSSAGLALSDITPEFVAALEGSSIEPQRKTAVRAKIMERLNDVLLNADGANMVSTALAACEAVRKQVPGGVRISAPAMKRVTRMMLGGKDAYLYHFANASNIDTIISLMNREDVPDPADFFGALSRSASPEVWTKLLAWYLRGNYDDIDSLIDRVTSSALQPADRAVVIDTLFPLPSSASRIYSFLLRHPEKVADLPATVRRMAEIAKEEFFSGIIANSSDNLSVINGLNDAVTIYFRNRLSADPNGAMKELIVFINKVKPVVYNNFSSSFEFIDTYLGHVEEHPGMQEKIILESLYPVRDVMSTEATARYTTLTDLYAGRVPAEVTGRVIDTAIAMNCSSAMLIPMFDKWLAGNVSPMTIKQFAAAHRRLSPDVIAAAVTSIWQRFAGQPEVRKEALLAFTDKVEWPKDQRRNFIAACTDKELAAFLGESDKFFSKLFRRFKNIF